MNSRRSNCLDRLVGHDLTTLMQGPIMSVSSATPHTPFAGSEPVTVDTDIRTHMLGTYAALRRLIAVVTAVFLLTLTGYRVFGHDPVKRESISSYYYHDNVDFRMKDVFVGALTSVALLLLAYQGYTDRENWTLNIAGTGLLCVVAFPMDWDPNTNSPGEMTIRGYVHYASAVTFFLSLGYVGLYRAHDTLGLLPDGMQKTLFKNLYRITGFFMVAVPVLAVVLVLRGYGGWIYVVEYFGVTVFLVYWLVKSYEMKVSLLETVSGVQAAEVRAVGPSGKKPGGDGAA